MPVNTKEVDTENYEGPEGAILTVRNSGSIKGPKALLSLYETMTVYKGPEGAVIIVQDNNHL